MKEPAALPSGDLYSLQLTVEGYKYLVVLMIPSIPFYDLELVAYR